MEYRELLSKAAGCLYGLAIGDAMGMPTSFLTPQMIQEQFGWVDRFHPPPVGHRYHAGLLAGEVTDDTEQSLALARSFIQQKRVDPKKIVDELVQWAERTQGKYASPLGPSTQRAIEQIQSGVPLDQAGWEGDTNGAAMRIAPLGIIHGMRGSGLEEVIADVVQACRPTHFTQPAISAAAGVAWGVAQCFQTMLTIDQLLDEIIRAARAAEAFGNRVVSASLPVRMAWVASLVKQGMKPHKFTARVYNFLGCGVAAADSIPAAIGVFAIAGGDPGLAIPLAVNMGGDCDTIASITGALAGAYSGKSAVPAAWIEEITRVNSIDFDQVALQLGAVSQAWQPAELLPA